jgi:dihydroflavonol-4-reductase
MDKGALLVTGATGLVGSNLCLTALKAGYRVRGLVRSTTGTEPLRKAGVELVIGDMTNAASLDAAAKGVQDIVHAAAVIGGTWSKSKPEDFWNVNYHGVLNLLDAAKKAGVRRNVCYSTIGILDWSRTASNSSPIVPISASDSPYIRSKRAAFYACMQRASVDLDVVSVLPGMIYGPGPIVERALEPTSCTATLLLGLRGELEQYVPMTLTWSYVHDVVAVGMAALEKGTNGSRYLASGRAEDACSLAEYCNRGNAIAGVAHRVKEIDLASGGKDIGTMKAFAERKVANPFVDASETAAALGVSPTPLDAGLRTTVNWLREAAKL